MKKWLPMSQTVVLEIRPRRLNRNLRQLLRHNLLKKAVKKHLQPQSNRTITRLLNSDMHVASTLTRDKFIISHDKYLLHNYS